MTDTTTGPIRPDLSIDQQLALRTAAVNLEREFAEFYGPETDEQGWFGWGGWLSGAATLPGRGRPA